MWKKVLSIGLLILVVLSAGCVGEGTGETGTSQENVIKIGVVADLSGPLSYTGVSVKNNLEIAKEDINNYFKKEGLPYQVELYVEDTRTDPKIALEKIQT
ncbi:MAG: branched-chain amino acid transport system substrate-binding protein, partial [Methanothermococcus sp.]|nr:branched-chain amino acid transport system substrate-binding protein [Methanothermococcus sp.]